MVHIFGQNEEKKAVKLYLVGQAEPIVLEPEMTEEEKVEKEILRLQEELKQLQEDEDASEIRKQVKGVKKNQRASKPTVGRKYVRLSDKLEPWGKVPQQQKDVAELLKNCMELGKEYSEAEVFDMLTDFCGDYDSLTKSDQHVHYVFRYYRGLKNDGKYGGFVARNFIRQIN